LVKVTLDSGESLEATAGHPFYIQGKGWNVAATLKVGDALQLHNGITLVIKTVDTSTRFARVYNFSVAQNANYFVGMDGVLVHNNGCGPKGGYGPGKPFSKKTKDHVWEQNTEKHDGVPTCEYCGTPLIRPQKSQNDVTPPPQEGQVDHVIPKAKGGYNSPSNTQLLCRVCNRLKWDK